MKTPLEELIPEYQNRLYAAAFGICRNRCDAEDVVQEAFLKYYLWEKDFESTGHIRSWLMRVTVNLARDRVRSFWNRNKVEWEDYMDSIPFESPEDRDLFAAVMKLPEKYRIVLHLYYYEDYSVQEIARILKKNENTVKSCLSRGRSRLKDMLKEEWKDD